MSFRNPHTIPESEFFYLTGNKLENYWSFCDTCLNDNVDSSKGLSLASKVLMFFVRLRKNRPFRDLAFDFEFHNLAELESMYHHIMIVYHSHSNEIPRMFVNKKLTGKQIVKTCIG